MKKQSLYYVKTSYGCGLRAAYNLREATATARRECGTNHFKSCEKATDEQIGWVRGMGGFVPKLRESGGIETQRNEKAG